MELQLKYSEVFTPETLYENYIEDKLEQDLVIPDYLSSAQKIIQCEARTVILDKSVSEDKITLDGLCIWKIMYLSEEDMMIHTLNCEKNFTEHFSLGKSGGMLRYKIKTKNVVCKLQSAQKAVCRATVCIAVQLTEQQAQTVVTGVEDESVQLRQMYVDAMIPVAEKECEFKVTGEIQLKHRKDVEVHKACSVLQIKERRSMDGKVLLKGSCKSRIILVSKEDRFAECVETETMFSQVFEVEKAKEGCVVIAGTEVLECDTQIGEEDGRQLLIIHTTALAQINLFYPEKLALTADAYHPEYELQCDMKQVPYYSKVLSVDVPIRCSQNVPMNANGIDVLYSDAEGEVDKITVQDGLMVIEGKVLITVMSLLDNEVMRTAFTLPFQTTRKSEDFFARMKCEAQISIDEIGYLITGESEMEISCECKLHLNVFLVSKSEAIAALALTERPVEHQMSSPLVLYYADAGEDLWEIGKKYRVPIRTLMENNHLECEEIKDSCLLFVTKR